MANTTSAQEQIVVHGALPQLLDMANDDIDIESQRQAMLTLNNLAVNEVNHTSMMNRDIMKILFKAYQSGEPDIREYAAFTIANICR